MMRSGREVVAVTESTGGMEISDDVPTVNRASAADRTKVILMAQVVVIVALVVVWSLLRGRGGSKPPGSGPATQER